MSTTYAQHTEIAVPSVDTAAAKAGIVAWVSSVLSSVAGARRRQADAEIARFIALNGGVMTDDMERAISRRYGSMVGR